MSEIRHLCDIRLGYRCVLWGDKIIVAPVDGSTPPYVYAHNDIRQGDVLPREGDKPINLC